ncbi:hypothetical protein TWF192_000849 [Orbilia oligospora]|uniref:Uncharacterized protein n=1 Tax=Orbilia oligospora TaxID=2813651 RepID=A0A6G1MG66_ORBOL|nr:hypothetical protein TWF679_001680 [Orbilia oligospora]KAF3216946.1 hypothetical protein TWF191_008850 [Orbilia oligospora]KAF3257556.1 hypothetical protein TWF192_000849 [Orbilia oligospora]
MFCEELKKEVSRADMEGRMDKSGRVTELMVEGNETSIIIEEDHDVRMNTPEKEDHKFTSSNINYGIREEEEEERIWPTLSTPKRPETLTQLPEEEEEINLLQCSDNDQDDEDDDSGYWTGRKRIRISVNKYKSRKPSLHSPEGDHLAFDRISPNSKYYKTPYVPSEKPVNRVLFPGAARRKKNMIENREEEKIQPQENDDVNNDVAEPEPQEPEPENIYDPLTPYRHTWTDSNLVVLYVLRRW